MKRKGIVVSIVFVLVVMLLGVDNVSAATAKHERTQKLDLKAAEFANDQSNQAEGWDWVATTNTLTLTDVNFNTGNYCAIELPENKIINIVLKGENKLSAKQPVIKQEGATGTAGVIFSGTGTLDVVNSINSVTFELIDLTIKEDATVNTLGGNAILVGDLKLESGKLAIKTQGSGFADGIYSMGNIEISGGTLDINAVENAIYMQPNKKQNLRITGGNVYLNSPKRGIYIVQNAQKDIYINTTGTITFKNCDIAMYSYSGNLEIVKAKIVLENVTNVYSLDGYNNTGKIIAPDADYTQVDKAIAKVPTDLTLYTVDSATAMQNALGKVIRGKHILDQREVDAYVAPIEQAFLNLVYRDADYSKVDAAIANIPTDLTLYTEESINKLNTAKQAVIRNKDMSEQAIVEGYATAIEQAIANLVYINANYSKVDAAIAKIPSDLSLYTTESVKELNIALKNVLRDKNITEQKAVDSYVTPIELAIANLVFRNADYSKVDAAISKIPSDLSLYTTESVKELNVALKNVHRDKNITEQKAVDAYVAPIELAIANLVYRDADYSKVDAAIAKIPSDLSLYTTESVKELNIALENVRRDKNITEQGIVDVYADKIEEAITKLKKTENITNTLPSTDDKTQNTDYKGVKTGDNVGSIGSMIVAMMISAFTITILKQKKVKE